MDIQVTHAKITKLIVELRSWETGTSLEERPTMNMLAERFQLPISAVKAIAESEGVDVRWVDPNASTLDLDPQKIDQALNEPETSPYYEDSETGTWKKKPTGEWERIP